MLGIVRYWCNWDAAKLLHVGLLKRFHFLLLKVSKNLFFQLLGFCFWSSEEDLDVQVCGAARRDAHFCAWQPCACLRGAAEVFAHALSVVFSQGAAKARG